MPYRYRAARRLGAWLILSAAVSLTLGCGFSQVYSSARHKTIALQPGDLEEYGIAFITPATAATQEEEKQTVALVFADVLKEERPRIPCLTLPETLNAISQAGLGEAYRQMYIDYRDTGLMNKDLLQKIGEITQSRYIAQLKLTGFDQKKDERLSMFGMRVLNTQNAQIRLFAQIWDSRQGIIAWEGVDELNHSEDTLTEENITLRTVLEQAARNLIRRLP